MKTSRISLGPALLTAIMVIGLTGLSAFSQTTTPDQNTPDSQSQPAAEPQPVAAVQPAPAPATNQPLIQDLEKISIGMTIADVKKLLGNPDVLDDSGAYFTPTKTHSIQIGLDQEKKVRTIASIYTDGDKQAPAITDVIREATAADNGDVYKLVRYNDAGIWIAYSRTNSKTKPMTVVTIRRIN